MSTKPLNLETETKASTNIGEEIRIELEKRGLRAPNTHKLVDEIKRMKSEIATSQEVETQVAYSEEEDPNLITQPAITADGKGQLVNYEAPARFPE